MFINKLLHHKKNVKLFLDASGMKIMLDLMNLAHLHTTRAYVPMQTAAIEASPDQARDTEREWYFSNKDREKEGPYSFKEVHTYMHAHTRTLCCVTHACTYTQTHHVYHSCNRKYPTCTHTHIRTYAHTPR